ncbi:putative membrane protein [Mycobacterium sp. OAS707]|uniref:SRPBCC family protein n=1 Tax=Mycobacterium sp. OAS707 TaxID=2663822 RepID=UPI00178A1610|nr:SRPBCC family protein [Mycobacterium sp. OAS707]MBE1550361.1 putative membrane protein [Mycobacterium sp. OAS707]
MARQTTQKSASSNGAGALQDSIQRLAGSMTDRAVSSVSDRLTGATGRLTDYAQNGGGGLLSAVTGLDDVSSPVKSALRAGVGGAAGKVKDSLKGVKDSVTEALGGKGGKGGGGKIKVTNIVEEIDVGVPIDVAYRQWTQFAEFPKFMKKVEQVEQVSDEKLRWKAQVFLSHRTWESTIVEQVPNDRIVWKSKGDKGYVDGAITFHELTPDLTRVVVVLEYHPQGLFEKTGNLWRAQGRRVRLELKHFQRQVMTDTILHADDVDGWQGEIRDGEVVSNDAESDEKSADRPKRRPRKTAARSKTSESKPSRSRTRTQPRSASGQRRSPARKAARS